MSRRDLSEVEMRRKLQQRKVPSEVVAQIIMQLKELGYLSDARLGAKMVENLCDEQHLGLNGIAAKLRKRGISNSIIMHELNQRDFSNEEEWARNLLAKRELTEPHKVARFLFSKGFSTPTISKIVGAFLSNSEE